MAGTIAKTMPVALGYDLGELVVCACSWGVDTINDPTSASLKGDILTSVTETGTGLFTATLKDTGYSVIAALPSMQTATTGTLDMDVRLQVIDTSANTVQVQIVARSTGAVTTAQAADANNRINLVLFLTRNSVSRHRS